MRNGLTATLQQSHTLLGNKLELIGALKMIEVDKTHLFIDKNPVVRWHLYVSAVFVKNC